VSSLALSLDAFERRGARRTFWIEWRQVTARTTGRTRAV